jgi:hypothetical protein
MEVTLLRLIPIKRNVSPILAPVGPKLNKVALSEAAVLLFLLQDIKKVPEKIKNKIAINL